MPPLPTATPDIDALMRGAIASQQQGNSEQARLLYQQVLGIQPDFAPALHNLGVLALQALQLEKAIAHLRRAYLLAPDEREVHNTMRELAMTLYRHNFWEQAQEWLLTVTARDPFDKEAQSVLARVQPRDYLRPEVRCEARGETLKRYSPREAASYIYVIDIVGTCNLRCPTCPVGNFPEAERPKGFMPFAMFEKILAKIDSEKIADRPELFLFNWGEPLLHPELHRFIELANEYGYPVTLSTNLNIKTDLEPMVAAGPAVIKLSLSGYTQRSYERTHRRGKLELFKANVFQLKALLDKHKPDTRIYIGQHIYRHNSEELSEVAELCRQLGFDHAPIQAFFQPLEKLKQVIDGELTAAQLPVLDLLQLAPRERYERLRASRPRDYDCELRFNQTVINHDGSVALCCGVYDSPNMLGVNFLDQPHAEIERRKYRHDFCKTCKQYEMDYSPTAVAEAL